MVCVLDGGHPFYVLHYMIDQSFLYIHSICENDGNPYISTFTLYHIPYIGRDELMVYIGHDGEVVGIYPYDL